MSVPFIAEIKMFGGTFAPRGYAFCDGQLLSIAQNTALFSIVGTTFGGDGETTFGLPDLRSRTPIHVGPGPGLTPRTWGEKVGTVEETLTEAQIPAHSHVLGASNQAATTGEPSNARSLGMTTKNVYGPANSLVSMGSTSGGGQSHNNRQPYLGVNFIIALVGTYPSRN